MVCALMVCVGALMVSTIRFPSSKHPKGKVMLALLGVCVVLLALLQERFFVLFFLVYVCVTLLLNIGWKLGWRGVAPGDWLLPFFQMTLLLAVLAFGFGLLALGILRLRLRAVVPLFVCSIAGGLMAAGYLGVRHIVPGAVGGLVVGLVLALLLLRW